MSDAAAAAPARRSRSRRALRLAICVAVLAIEALLVVPHLSFSSASVAAISWPLLLAALGCELVSIIAFSRMRRRLLQAGGTRIGRRRMGVLTLASNAVSTTAPAGTALSAAYLYQQFRRHGATATVTVWVLAAGSVVSAMAFAVLTVFGTLLDGDLDVGEIIGAGGVSFAIGAALVAGLALATKHPKPLLRGVERIASHLPRRWVGPDGRRLHALTRTVLDQLTVVTPRTRDWAVALVLSVLNWSADLACFVLCCYAVGAHGLGLGAAAVAYAAGLATIGISLTPGGLGSLEAGMLIGLASGGVAAPTALAGVLAYRVVAYVIMGGVGWAVWFAVRHDWRRRTVDEPDVIAPVLAPAIA